MNLAQAVPPEFAQERFPSRAWAAPAWYVSPGARKPRVNELADDVAYKPRRRAEPVAPQPATAFRVDPAPARPKPRGRHAMPLSGSPRLIRTLKLLAKLAPGRERSAVEIRDGVAPAMFISDFCATLRRLKLMGLVDRTGKHRSYRYSISAEGRDVLEKVKAEA